MTDSLEEYLKKPIIEKLLDCLVGIQGNIDGIYKESTGKNEIEYARANGQIWALTLCKGMIEAVIRLEKRKGEKGE